MKREDIVLQDAGAGKGKRIAIFPGAFDPFTKGHASLVERGLLMVDEIIIAIGINGNKKNCFPLEERLAAIRELYKESKWVPGSY